MKNKFWFHLCFVSFLAFSLTACKVKRPDNVLPEPEMENLLYDYHIAKAMGDYLPYNESYKKVLYIDAVFQKYGTTEAVFDSSIVWYTRNTEVLSKIYEKINKRMKADQDEINHLIALRDNKPKMSEPGDSIDVWPWRRMLRLTGKKLNNYYTFVLPGDSNYKDRDTLVWEARYHFLHTMPADSTGGAAMAMQIVYDKDTISRLEHIDGPGVYRIRLFADTLGTIREVKGFIYYASNDSLQGGTLLADRFSLLRYHCTDTLPVAVRDSVNKAEKLKTDSLKQQPSAQPSDSLQQAEPKETPVRLSPEEMNRRRTSVRPEKRQEQIEVERHIQEEQEQQRKERGINQRRIHQQRSQTRR